MVEETKKIMGDDTIRVTATCVRVPVWGGHSESVNVEFEKPCDVEAARAALGAAPGVIVRDVPGRSEYPMPVDVWDTDPVYVGRIRRDRRSGADSTSGSSPTISARERQRTPCRLPKSGSKVNDHRSGAAMKNLKGLPVRSR